MPTTGWLNFAPKASRRSDFGQATPWTDWLKQVPNVICCTASGHGAPPARGWSKKVPYVSVSNDLGHDSASTLWLNLLPKVISRSDVGQEMPSRGWSNRE